MAMRAGTDVVGVGCKQVSVPTPAEGLHLSLMPWGSKESVGFLRRLDARTINDPLLAHQEGHFKIEVLRTALSLGYRIQEPSPRADRVFEASPSGPDGSWPMWSEAPRIARVTKGSCDLVLRDDAGYLLVELKCRPDQGSKAQAAMGELRGDLERVVGDPRFMFLSVMDEQIYRSFSGDKSERRGRKASERDLVNLFPSIDSLVGDDGVEIVRTVSSMPMRFWLRRQVLACPAGALRPESENDRFGALRRIFILGRCD
jgi:hypothetical protein